MYGECPVYILGSRRESSLIPNSDEALRACNVQDMYRYTCPACEAVCRVRQAAGRERYRRVEARR